MRKENRSIRKKLNKLLSWCANPQRAWILGITSIRVGPKATSVRSPYHTASPGHRPSANIFKAKPHLQNQSYHGHTNRQ